MLQRYVFPLLVLGILFAGGCANDTEAGRQVNAYLEREHSGRFDFFEYWHRYRAEERKHWPKDFAPKFTEARELDEKERKAKEEAEAIEKKKKEAEALMASQAMNNAQ